MPTDVQLPSNEPILYGTSAPDTFNNQTGVETAVSYINSPSAVGAYLATSSDAFGWGQGDKFTNVQDLVGSNYDDYLWGDGRNNNLYGGAGADTLYGFATTTTSTTHLYGDSGDDTLLGGMGIDVIDGGSGENTVSYYLAPAGLTVSLADQSLNTGWAAGDTFTNVQDVVATKFNDIIYGGNFGGVNQLQGEEGNDVIYGGNGYNVLIGGAGADALHGAGTGNLVDYETSTAGLTASLANPSINTGDAAGDTYFTLTNADLAGSPFDDILYGDSGNNHLIGDPDVSVYNHYGNDQLHGGAGNDILEGGPGADLLDGGDGYDYASYTTAVHASLLDPSTNTGDAAGDTYISIEGIFGSNFDDVLAGDGNDNTLFGEAGNDTLIGNGGTDQLDGGPGADHLVGSTSGFAYASYGDSPQGLTVSLANPSINTGDAAGDTYTNILGISGSNYNDVLYGDANNNVIQGGAGDDVIYGGGGNDLISGGDGNDIIIAGAGSSTLIGGAGADTFTFLHATDSVSTPQIAPTQINDFQTGIDKIDISAVQPESVSIVQENGFYTLEAVTANGTLYVRSVNQFSLSDVITSVPGQTITGTSGYDKLVGGAGADIIIGGGTGDNLTGGGGPDTFRYLASSDSTQQSYDIITDFQHGVDKIDLAAVAPSYISMLHSGGATYLFPSTPGGQMEIAAIGDVEGNDLVLNTAANLYIVGDNNADTLIGGAGSDTIVGGSGNDIIIGGGSGDALYGGAGANTFAYQSTSDSTPSDYDIIHDFKTGTDVLDLTGIGPSNVSIVHYNGGTFVSGGTAQGVFQIGSTQTINGSDIHGLTGGTYIVGDDVGDTLIGSANQDTIVGGAGNDVITGGGGSDALYGGGGSNTFVYTQSSDSNAYGYDILHDFKTGVDKIDFSAMSVSNVSINHYNGGTFIFGNSPSGSFELGSTQDINAGDLIGLTSGAYIVGDDRGDTLKGASFDETIQGGAGNDIIIGGGGSDALYGGAGADVFKYLAASDSTPSKPDFIHDFQDGIDKIDLTAVHTGSKDTVNIVNQSDASYVFVDQNGDGVNDMLILVSDPHLHMSDIMW